jgi:uncharacterized MAPEG superfamily protein
MPSSLTIAAASILAAGVLPFVFLLLSTVPSKGTPTRWGQGYDNDNARASLERLEGWRKRAHFAQMNGHEAFPPFAAGMIVAHLAAVSPPRMLGLAALFLGARVVHGAFYVGGFGMGRSVVWGFGALAVVLLFVSALTA